MRPEFCSSQSRKYLNCNGTWKFCSSSRPFQPGENCGSFDPQAEAWEQSLDDSNQKQGRALIRILLSTSIVWGLSMSASAADLDPDPDRYIVSFLDVGKGKAALKAAGARVELELPGRRRRRCTFRPRR
jgi:hypothetical protein